MKETYVIPPQANAAFVCNMEDVLAVYTRPYDPRRPQICMDETNTHLEDELYPPLPMQPGQAQRVDYLGEPTGKANLFMCFEPLAGKRYVQVADTRTRKDWAHVMQWLADTVYPDAEVLVVVMDNLNTHSPSSFYETFAPAEAWRLSQRFEFHYTPKHGSWLNMAEIELSVLVRQCLARRIPDLNTLIREVNAWQTNRNAKTVSVDWRFTTADARIRLKHLYPGFHP